MYPKEYDKTNSHIKSNLLIICVSSNNVAHPVAMTFTKLYWTSLHLPTLHFLSFKLHPSN